MTTEFTKIETNIPGLLVFNVTILEDNRGWFQEKFQKEKLVSLGLPLGFAPVQHSVSFNREVGVTRGIHAEPWDKYIGIISGKVFAAFVDLRRGENFGKVFSTELDEKKTVFLPKGVGNSFQTLQPDTYYSYLVNDHWKEASIPLYKFVNMADPTLQIKWPIPLGGSIISEKDKMHPNLIEISPFE